MDTNQKANALAKYVRSLNDFTIDASHDEQYNHMGATITDAILQAGTTYETVVRPRVKRVLNEYPQVNTTSTFLELLENQGAAKVLSWIHPEKPERIKGVCKFFKQEQIETENDLKEWLSDNNNRNKLMKLRGVGPKTADYFKILVGIQTNAVDIHLLNFINQAGIEVANYGEAQEVINQAADILDVERALFDQSIWKYMSSKKKKTCPTMKRNIVSSSSVNPSNLTQGYIRGLSQYYNDGLERMEIAIDKKNAFPLPYRDKLRIPIKLQVDGKIYDAGLRSTPYTSVVWVCPDLRDIESRKISLARVLTNSGFSKNQKVHLELKGNVVELSSSFWRRPPR